MAERHETPSPDRPSSQYSLTDQSQAPIFEGLKSRHGNIPIMYPALVPGLFPPQLEQDQMNRGPGLYAVPVLPFGQPVTGFPSDYLIPFTYNIPTTASGNREVPGEQGGQHQQQQEAGPQRQVVVRRFEIAIHIDLLLILKLVAVIFLFNHDGSKQRLALLVVLASLVYLHQTGALAPLIRWLSQRTQRAAGVGPRADNLPAADARVNENVAGADPVGVNENQQVNDGNTAAENENAEVPEQAQAVNRWWGIVKEIQLIATAFVTSLLPGFNNLD